MQVTSFLVLCGVIKMCVCVRAILPNSHQNITCNASSEQTDFSGMTD